MLLSELSKFILPEVIGCPDPVLLQAVNQTAYEFFDKSGAWIAESTVPVTSASLEYAFPAVADAVALRIRDAWLNGERLTPASRRESIVSLSYHSAGGQSLILSLPLDGDVTVRTVYAPVNSIPDALFVRYSDAISSGAKARLMLMPSPWANPSLASYYASRFASGIQDAYADAEHDNTFGSLRVVPRRFA